MGDGTTRSWDGWDVDSQGTDAGHTDCDNPLRKRRLLSDGSGFPTNPMAHVAGASTSDASTSNAVVGLGFKGLNFRFNHIGVGFRVQGLGFYKHLQVLACLRFNHIGSGSRV